MYICDCHCDTLTKNYNQNESLFDNDCQLDIKRIIENGGGLQFFAIWIPQEYRFGQSIKYTLMVLDKYYRELETISEKAKYIQIRNKDDVKGLENYDIGMLLAIEGGDAIQGSLEVLRMYYRLGIRCMTITWNYRNELADGVKETVSGGGLTEIGREVICEMNRIGMLIDVSHISTRGFWDIIDLSNKPIIATHSNCRTLCDIERNLSDEQIKAISNKGGVVGINIYPHFLCADYTKADIDSIYRHIDYVLNICGEDSVGIGTDFDGIDIMPAGITGVESINKVFDYLSKKNYSVATIEKIAHKNVRRLLESVL